MHEYLESNMNIYTICAIVRNTFYSFTIYNVIDQFKQLLLRTKVTYLFEQQKFHYLCYSLNTCFFCSNETTESFIVFNSSNKTVHQFGIIPAALFDISGCKRIEM